MKIKIAIVMTFIVLLLTGCKDTGKESDEGNNVITDFLSNNYEYTITYYNITPDGIKTFMYAFDGQLISNPYQQYEKLAETSETPGFQEAYYYEKDGNIYSDTKLFTSGEKATKWLTGMVAEKPAHFYDEEGLTFTYDRKEKLNGTNLSVFTAEYQTVNISSNEEKTLEMPCVIKLEYYVDIKNQKLIQAIVDMEDFCKVGAISEKMLHGNSESEAREAIESEKDYNILNLKIEFKNSDKDLTISPPYTSITYLGEHNSSEIYVQIHC